MSHGISKIEESRDHEDPIDMDQQLESEASQESTGKSPLEAYAVNLNMMAKKGKIDPLVGREPEIERTIQVLCRRRKNNPLFVGEAGVGKTAIAEGLAKLIVEGNVPDALRKLYSLRFRFRVVISGNEISRRF
jgi:ATP-dependent Clp protease ATP-binding subunit ClpA